MLTGRLLKSPGCCQACPPRLAESTPVAEPPAAEQEAARDVARGERRANVEDAALTSRLAGHGNAGHAQNRGATLVRWLDAQAMRLGHGSGTLASEAGLSPFCARSCLARSRSWPGGA